MSSAKHRIKVLKIDAEILRYCGFKARADYQAMEIVVRTPMFGWEVTKLQEQVDSCIRVPAEFIKDHSAYAGA